MRLAFAKHLEHGWRVHELARDFKLIDVWGFPIRADPSKNETFLDFVRIVAAVGPISNNRAADGLLKLRVWLGQLFGWDRDNHTLPIPGCVETSVADRLTDEDRRRNRADQVQVWKHPVVDLKVVYLFEDEFLVELSNKTIHALLHIGWVDAGEGSLKTPQMAIYVKSRGLTSDLYIALIDPFRYLVIYPMWVRRITDEWQKFTRDRNRARSIP